MRRVALAERVGGAGRPGPVVRLRLIELAAAGIDRPPLGGADTWHFVGRVLRISPTARATTSRRSSTNRTRTSAITACPRRPAAAPPRADCSESGRFSRVRVDFAPLRHAGFERHPRRSPGRRGRDDPQAGGARVALVLPEPVPRRHVVARVPDHLPDAQRAPGRRPPSGRSCPTTSPGARRRARRCCTYETRAARRRLPDRRLLGGLRARAGRAVRLPGAGRASRCFAASARRRSTRWWSRAGRSPSPTRCRSAPFVDVIAAGRGRGD